MRQSGLLTLLCLIGFAGSLRADGLSVFPAAVVLDGPDARQQLVITETASGKHSDQTTNATYTTNSPGVATVSRDGVVTPVSDGEAVITATVNGATAKVMVKIENTMANDAQPSAVLGHEH